MRYAHVLLGFVETISEANRFELDPDSVHDGNNGPGFEDERR